MFSWTAWWGRNPNLPEDPATAHPPARERTSTSFVECRKNTKHVQPKLSLAGRGAEEHSKDACPPVGLCDGRWKELVDVRHVCTLHEVAVYANCLGSESPLDISKALGL